MRATSGSFVSDAARFSARVCPISVGKVVTSFGSVEAAAQTLSGVHVIGRSVP